MNPIAGAFLVVLGVATFFSYTEDWLRKNVRAGNWDQEARQEWAAARNLRPCVGARDASCVYPPAAVVVGQAP